MIQFTREEIVNIRKKASQNKEIIKWLIDENKVLENPLTVPAKGIATWNLYYFCPTHSVRLDWQMDSPTEHRCPVDGEILTGEPYDGAWWRWMNGLNAKACYHGGLLWQITGDKKYLDKVREILLEYAKYYPGYEEHGGIPYNGPGKANAQTLCEANCHKDFILGYDLISDDLVAEDKKYIEERLLREGADFLIQHRADQLHNHEVKIGGTVGLIGLVLDDKKYLDFALNNKYGLIYQLENGVAEDGLWFEGSVHYHYYALQGLLTFEKAARNTKYSNLDHPNFKKMLSVPLELLLPNNEFPKLNDSIKGQERLTHTELFEFAYSHYGDEIYGETLNTIYKNQERNNIDAFLYGVEELPKIEVKRKKEDSHLEKSGLTIFRENKKKDTYFLMKHTPYGGEHDHYDRLGIILYNNGEEVFHDLGTTGYGAKLHYDYFKNTLSHNTISVNGENQPPANPRTIDYREGNGYRVIDAKVDWSVEAEKLDSFTRVQWDADAYKDVKYRRSILWLEDHFIEVINIKNPHKQDVFYSLHTKGSILEDGVKTDRTLAKSTPASYLKDLEILDKERSLTVKSSKNNIRIYSLPQEIHLKGKGPGNPSIEDIDYFILENKREDITIVNLFDFSKGNIVEDVKIGLEGVKVEVSYRMGTEVKNYILTQKENTFEVIA